MRECCSYKQPLTLIVSTGLHVFVHSYVQCQEGQRTLYHSQLEVRLRGTFSTRASMNARAGIGSVVNQVLAQKTMLLRSDLLLLHLRDQSKPHGHT
jgi:hypothetical protein